MSLPNIIHGGEEQTFKVNTSTVGRGMTPVGAKMVIEDGRTYRWTHVGVGPTIVGHLWQAELWDKAKWGSQNVGTITAAQIAAGHTVITAVDSTSNDLAVNVLKEGYVLFDDGVARNPLYKIVSNTAITNGDDAGTITIGSPLVDNVLAAEKITYVKNTYQDVIQCPAPLTAAPAGVPVAVIADEGFGWLATGGPVRALTTGTLALGDACVSSATTAGGFMPAAAEETDGPYLGIVMVVTGSGEYAGVFLNFDH